MSQFIVAIDQGTTSTRALVIDHDGRRVAGAQREHAQLFPRAGWVEHDAAEIWRNTQTVVRDAMAEAGITSENVAAVGVANQRETTVVWDRSTGEPIHNAIVWQCTRTQAACDALAEDGGVHRFHERTGLPLATYFSGPKVAWILDPVDGARERAEAGELAFGTIDSWLIWNLTGGEVHATDVTNASRTLLMGLDDLAWQGDICEAIGVPQGVLPEIRPSSGDFGTVSGIDELAGVPITGVLGDQQAACFGQVCFEPGQVKNTYGTGNFLLMHTGEQIVRSDNGLLSTVAFQLDGQPPTYALEGSIAVTGSLVQWLRDNLGMISEASQVESLAQSVDDNGDVYIVPAFSGLFAPYWRSDARGAIVGLTRYANKGHIARAALESTAFQTRDVVEAMQADSGVPLKELKVDGAMTANDSLMQFQADQLDAEVIRPVMTETTTLGAAYAAGLHVGYWADLDELRANWSRDKSWTPSMDADERERLFASWHKAVDKSLGWVEE